nr:MAG TPA: hypothetical protein [Caudoviricetes sp.]
MTRNNIVHTQNKQFEYFHKSMCYSNTFSIFAKKLQIWI